MGNHPQCRPWPQVAKGLQAAEQREAVATSGGVGAATAAARSTVPSEPKQAQHGTTLAAPPGAGFSIPYESMLND
jgi:hypothetical protein